MKKVVDDPAFRGLPDEFEVMVRTGPDLSHKIIAMPKSGTPVEILEKVLHEMII